VRKELGDRTALLGCAGSPWTLATFMMEGGSAEKYTRALNLFRKEPKTFNALVEKLTAAVTAYLEMQIEAGVDAIQIFDSHGGLLAPLEFQEASGRWMREIISRLGGRVPVIVFSLGTHGNWDDLINTGASVLGIDWRFPLADARRLLPAAIGLQGNLAPSLLNEATEEATAAETSRLLEVMRGRKGYIFNLGHGVPPDAKLENIAALVETVKIFK
jgi:uroporphyrinogen decarboxylase